MRIVKLILISVIIFSLMITSFSLFFPSRVRISKAIDINTTRDSVMRQITEPENWKNWYPGADTADLMVIEGKVKGISTGNKQGLMIDTITDSSVVAVNVGPASKRSETGWNLFPTSIPNTITIQSYMDFHLRWYPWEKFASLLLEKRYGPVLEKSLENLKAWLEK
jgi:hypothetical protein